MRLNTQIPDDTYYVHLPSDSSYLTDNIQQTKKEYICKVVGVFPECSEDSPILCRQPITVFNRKLGYVASWPVQGFEAKSAETEFVRLHTDGETSVVLCKPKTGSYHC